MLTNIHSIQQNQTKEYHLRDSSSLEEMARELISR